MDSTLTKTNIVTIKCGEGFLREDGIVQFNIIDDYILEVQDINEINEGIKKLNGNTKTFNLFFFEDYTNISHDAIKYSNNPVNYLNTKADAFVIKSVHQKLLANFFINIMKPPVPTKYFMNEEAAVSWLKSL